MSLLALGAAARGRAGVRASSTATWRPTRWQRWTRRSDATAPTSLAMTVMPGPAAGPGDRAVEGAQGAAPGPHHRLGRLLPDPALGGGPPLAGHRLRGPRPRRAGLPRPASDGCARATTRATSPGAGLSRRGWACPAPTTSRPSPTPTSSPTSPTTASTWPAIRDGRSWAAGRSPTTRATAARSSATSARS